MTQYNFSAQNNQSSQGGFGTNQQNKTQGNTQTGSSWNMLGTGNAWNSGGTGNSWNSNSWKSWGKGFGQQQPAHVAVLNRDELFNRVWNLRCAYNPSSESYRFCYVFYNKRQNAEQKIKCPENISETKWQDINCDCPDPDHLIPCPLMGFDALVERTERQKEMKDKLVERIKLIQDKLREMTSFYATELQGLFEKIHQNSIKIEQSLLEVIESEEIKRNQGKPITDEELKMLSKIERMQFEIGKPGKFKSAIQELSTRTMDRAARTSSHLTIDKESLGKISLALKNNQDALEALEKLTKETAKAISNLEAQMEGQ